MNSATFHFHGQLNFFLANGRRNTDFSHTFDIRPTTITRDLCLCKPIFQQTASYGHFERDDLDVAWECTDKAAILRDEAGLK